MPAFDLSGLYVITDSRLIPESLFAETVESAVRGGVSIVQLREKETEKEEIIRKGKMILKITRKYKIPLIVNDSVVMAEKIGADGVHLGEEDGEVEEARKLLGSGTIIGVSCYGDIERGLRAEKAGANYAAFGTPYFTPTKPERKPTRFEVLKEAKAKLDIPVFAIGGITAGRIADIAKTGVDGIAVITAVFGEKETEKEARKLTELFQTSKLQASPGSCETV